MLVHSPDWAEMAKEMEQRLRSQGIDVYRLNTGVEEEREEAKRLLELCE